MTDATKILLRIPESLHREVKRAAEEAGVSINRMLRLLLETGLRAGAAGLPYRSIVHRAHDLYGPNYLGLLLFGSRARGDHNIDSDTDLLLVISREIPMTRALYRAWDGTLPEGLSLHISPLPNGEHPPGSLWLECAIDGRILDDPSRQLSTTLQHLKERVISGEFVRKMTHGQGYWVST